MSEGEMEGDAKARFVDARVVAIGKSPHIFEPQYAQDVVESGGYLHVGSVADRLC